MSLILIHASCGIDEYVYLEPPTSVEIVSSDSLRVQVNVPAQNNDYFDEYLIYYKIYPTSSDQNTLIATNLETITNANENYPATLESVLKNLSFQTIAYGEDTQDSTISEMANPLTSSSDSSFIIEFNLASTQYPYLSFNTIKYRLLRNSEVDIDTDQRDFLYSTLVDSYTAGSSVRPSDVVASSSYSAAHVLLVIVASGHDSNFSVLHSTAMEIGIFPLDD